MSERYTDFVSPTVSRRLLTTADYHSMIAAGILTPEDRVELLAGEIYEAASIGSRHASCVMRLNRWFSARVGERAIVNVQNPIELSDFSEPEPDLTLVEPRDDFYSERNPTPDEVLLLIEVADSSLEHDRGLKLSLYAQAGVREVWIVALGSATIELFREPVGGEYRVARRRERGQSVRPAALPQIELALDELFG